MHPTGAECRGASAIVCFSLWVACNLQVLLLGANPESDASNEPFVEAAKEVMRARPGLDVVWRAAAGGMDQA
jgi:hypothetical protein